MRIFVRTTVFTLLSFAFLDQLDAGIVRETSSTISHSSMASSSSKPLPPRPSPFPLPVQLFAQQLMHKNRLQEFAQKCNIALPVYQTNNEGQQHAPRFRSKVWVDGMSYISQSTFSHRKTAEQDAARLAMECLPKRTRDEAPSLDCEISAFCKSILNEYATKLKLEGPTYKTVQQEGLLPSFISSLVFNGTSYTGDAARNKKDAEQLAASAAILSILNNSGSGSMLAEMIKSKSKLNHAIKRKKGVQGIHLSTVTPNSKTGNTCVRLGDKEFAGSVADKNVKTEVEFLESSRMVSPSQEFKIPKQELFPSATKGSNVYLPRSSAPTFHGGSSLKRHREK